MARKVTVVEALRHLGYTAGFEVEGRTSIADLFRAKSRRCGVYVLEFRNGEVYGGQAVDVTRRFVQHLKTHDDVVRIYFRCVPRSDLDEVEQRVIHTLERSGFLTRNIVFSSVVVGETDLDVVMPVDMQEEFRRSVTFNDNGGNRTNDPGVRRRLDGRYTAFATRPHGAEVESLLREYVPACVPASRRTELAFWGVSLPPRPRFIYARVNVGWQEVLTALEENDGSLWYTFHVAASPLGLKSRGRAAWERVEKTLGVEVVDHAYTPGGQDQVQLVASARTAKGLLRKHTFLDAARRLNLLLMRKGPTPYGKFHSFALADRLLADARP